MRRRLYFVLPDLASAQRTMNDLLLARIEERHIHCLARRGTPMDGLHEANVLQKTDLVRGGERGLLLGWLGGIVLGFILILVPLEGVRLQLVTVLITSVAGALFGMWVASLTGASVPNSSLLAFAKDIEEGRILMMVDVPARRVEEIRKLVEGRHPEAAGGGVDPTIPAFP